MDLGATWQTVVIVAGGITLLGGTFGVIRRWLAPAIKLSKDVEALKDDVEALKEHDKADLAAILENRTAASTLCRTALAIIDHELYGNGVDKLKRIKEDVNQYLVDRK